MRLGNRTYRVWEKLELPKYFLNLHLVCATTSIVHCVPIISKFTIVTQVATYIANALVGGVSNPDLKKKA